MTVLALKIEKEDAQHFGLEAIEMSRLGNIVALTGKNGSGKTRLLNLVESFLTAKMQVSGRVNDLTSQMDNLKRAVSQHPGNAAIGSWTSQIKTIEDNLRKARGINVEEGRIVRAIRFVPKNLSLGDPLTAAAQRLRNSYESIATVPIDGLAASCLHYIQQAQNRYWTASHQSFAGDRQERDAAIDDYNRLNTLIDNLLQASLSRSINDEATIFGRPLAQANLSDGQKVLIQLAVAIHTQAQSLDDAVLLLDEIENHLHPDATIEIIKRIQGAGKNLQLWIATHSIPVLAYAHAVDPMSLWFLNGGSVSHSGRHVNRVLNGLLGSEDGINQLHNFTGLPATLAALNYAAQSLLPPTTVPAMPGDPQIQQIHGSLTKLRNDDLLTVLDFGAGKGRILDGLSDLCEGQPISQRISYFAFDENSGDKDTCLAAIGRHFGDERPRYFNGADEFFSAKDDGSMDVVLMCNVLHEISPAHWLSLFAEDRLVSRALKSDGYVFIVEDMRIPVGEKAHEFGFIVLDTPHLKSLFSITEVDIELGHFVSCDLRGDGRLKGHLIARTLLLRISSDTRTKAITELKATALEAIRRIRTSSASYSDGLLHAFWTQQLANCQIFLEESGAGSSSRPH